MIVMKSFGLFGLFGQLWLSNDGVEMQDRESVVVQEQIWWAVGGGLYVQNGSPAFSRCRLVDLLEIALEIPWI